jgi:hypothetical protein
MTVERIAGVGLTDVFRRDGTLYEVVCIASDPTVTLRPVGADPADGAELHLVIGSPLFHEWEHLTPKEER